MKNTIVPIILTLVLGLLLHPGMIYAQEAGTAAVLATHTIEVDTRAQHLKSYLNSQNSPLSEDAEHFVSEADRLNIDWKLVAAIAGVESTFGKHIPTNSNNAWGWAVFTGREWGAAFKDWSEGITTVSEGLKYNYIDKGAETIEQIGRIYAASPTWSWKVRFFLEKIEEFVPTEPKHLEVTI